MAFRFLSCQLSVPCSLDKSNLCPQEKGGLWHCLDPQPPIVLPKVSGTKLSSATSTESCWINWLNPSLQQIRSFFKVSYCICLFHPHRGCDCWQTCPHWDTNPQFNVHPCSIPGDIPQSVRSWWEGLTHQQEKTDSLSQITCFHIIPRLSIAWMLQQLRLDASHRNNITTLDWLLHHFMLFDAGTVAVHILFF